MASTRMRNALTRMRDALTRMRNVLTKGRDAPKNVDSVSNNNVSVNFGVQK